LHATTSIGANRERNHRPLPSTWLFSEGNTYNRNETNTQRLKEQNIVEPDALGTASSFYRL
jgi:hypothetical protein